jgi:hypothetical protein
VVQNKRLPLFIVFTSGGPLLITIFSIHGLAYSKHNKLKTIHMVATILPDFCMSVKRGLLNWGKAIN